MVANGIKVLSAGTDDMCETYYECPECGSESIYDHFKFCPGCGRPIAEFAMRCDKINRDGEGIILAECGLEDYHKGNHQGKCSEGMMSWPNENDDED